MRSTHLLKRFFPFILLSFFSLSCVELIGTISTIPTDPKLTWNTIETKNFRIHFSNGLLSNAEKVGQYCEEAHKVLGKELQWDPWDKVEVVVVDFSDSPDARAIQFPFPQLLVFLARPNAGEALDNYDNWLRTVIFHEYTHLLQMDIAGGFWKGVRYAFGRAVLPNAIIPTWMSEGYAVFEESDKTTEGRNRGSYVDMVLRMDALENSWPPIDTLTIYQTTWPYGASAYFFGGRFYEWLSEKYPEPNEKFRKYFYRYGNNALLFFLLNYQAKKVFGKTYYQLYKEFKQDLSTHYQKQKTQIESKGLTQANRLTHDGDWKGGLLYTPDGKNLITSTSSADVRSKLIKINPRNPKEIEVLRYDYTAPDMVWGKDHKKILSSQQRSWKDYYYYYQLMAFDMNTKHAKQIRFRGGKPLKYDPKNPRNPYDDTRRFTNPDFSSANQRMIFVAHEQLRDNLWEARFSEKGEYTWDQQTLNIRQITHVGEGTSFNNPRFSPDGEKIAVSVFDPKKQQRNIILLTKDAKFLQFITNDTHIDYYPLWSKSGKHLYFLSDRSGVFNLYVMNLNTKQTKQVTNVLGGVFYPALSPDESKLAFIGYHSRGYDLFEMPLNNNQEHAKSGESLGRNRVAPGGESLGGNRVPIDPSNTDAEEEIEDPEDQSQENVTPYSPWKRLLVPRFLSPIALIIDDDSFIIGGATGSVDTLRKHAWTLSGFFRTDINEAGGQFRYSYAGWYPEISLQGLIAPVIQNAFLYGVNPITGDINRIVFPFPDGYLVQRDLIGRIGASMQLPVNRIPGFSWVQGRFHGSANYEYIYRHNVSDIPPTIDIDPAEGNVLLTQTLVPTEYRASGFDFHLTYDSTIHRRRGISPTGEINQLQDFLRGYSFLVGLQVYDDLLGGNWDQQIVTVDLRQYRRIPFTRHHVLALRALGAFAFGDQPNPSTFQVGGNFSEGVRNVQSRNFYPLRGFGSRSFDGEKVYLFSGEYRLPIVLADRGLGTTPLFLKDLYMVFFADYGEAWDSFANPNDSGALDQGEMGIGAEIRAHFTLFYHAQLDGRLGWGIPVLTNGNAFFDIGDGDLILNLGTTF